jgi:4-alpha-glucanotransferase
VRDAVLLAKPATGVDVEEPRGAVCALLQLGGQGREELQPRRGQLAAEPEQRAQGEAVLGAILDEAGATIVIAEDLGVIPPFVRASLKALGVPGYKVMRWEKVDEGTVAEAFTSPADYPELSLATTGTHDTDTLAEWWDAAPGRTRADASATGACARGHARREDRLRQSARRDAGGAVRGAVADGDHPDSGSFWMA